ncbi:hypothetical protein ACFV0D_07885 [Streptomyces sp. NPDC059556]|uniref:hypothetical protein n=1 Tax=Streptomyces sp. NPDC059556 TaxID=3346863 RepID=UPI0036A87CF8
MNSVVGAPAFGAGQDDRFRGGGAASQVLGPQAGDRQARRSVAEEIDEPRRRVSVGIFPARILKTVATVGSGQLFRILEAGAAVVGAGFQEGGSLGTSERAILLLSVLVRDCLDGRGGREGRTLTVEVLLDLL